MSGVTESLAMLANWLKENELYDHLEGIELNFKAPHHAAWMEVLMRDEVRPFMSKYASLDRYHEVEFKVCGLKLTVRGVKR